MVRELTSSQRAPRNLALLACAMVACSRATPERSRGHRDESVVVRPPAPPWESAEARAELARAPDSSSCTADADCLPFHGGGTAPPAVCCEGSTTGVANRAYGEWVQRFRARFCAGAPCESPPLPGALPADCFFEGRCVNARCATACDVAPKD
jgi:hypothetical protein